ncbi:MAG: GTPase [Gemmatimonadetes bacterium]|nr:GTPase [Gemmatimonadota bacterium]
MSNERTRVVICGAGGRDFHVFNTRYRHDPTSEVVAFTAAQIPHIEERRYPPELAGALYPEGIEIHPEDDLEILIDERSVDDVIFAYSDVPLAELEVMSERVASAGARFQPYDVAASQLPVTPPCVAVCAVRTGCGKSGVARHLAAALGARGHRVGVVRHPMPYGDLRRQVVQRFETVEDLARHECTIEEMEEYEPHIVRGSVVYAGADYLKILGLAEFDADVVLWDGGNNDASFLVPDVLVTLLDPLRAGDEVAYFPSAWNLDHADILVVAKTDQATQEQIDAVLESARVRNPGAEIVMGGSPYSLDRPDLVAGKRVLVVEDGPTTTHGGMGYGAGLLAAKAAGAAEIVDPRPYASGEIAEAFEHYPHLHDILPALGYGTEQLGDLEETINRVECDAVVVGTPIDLSRVVTIEKPAVRASYGYADAGDVALAERVVARLGV